MTEVPCCARAETCHIHYYEHDEKSRGYKTTVHEVDPIADVTFLLKGGYSEPSYPKVGEKCYEEDLIFFGENVWVALRDTEFVPTDMSDWEVFFPKRSWHNYWSDVLEYSAGTVVIAADRLYQSLEDTLCVYPPNSPLWKELGDMGCRFPPWMRAKDTITFPMNLGNNLIQDPTTGGQCRILVPELQVGEEYMDYSNLHPLIQKVYAGRYGSADRVRQIYTIKSVHCGKTRAEKSVNNQNPEEETFIGFNIGVYILGDQDMQEAEAGADAQKTPAGNANAASKSAGTCYNNAIPLVDENGKAFQTIYIQWRADTVGYIIQSDSMLTLFNRHLYPHYENIMKSSKHLAQKGNVMDISLQKYKIQMLHDPNINVDELSSREISLMFAEWQKNRNAEKLDVIERAKARWATANSQWIKWLGSQHDRTKLLRSQCEDIQRSCVPQSRWFIDKLPNVTWEVPGDRKIGKLIAPDETFGATSTDNTDHPTSSSIRDRNASGVKTLVSAKDIIHECDEINLIWNQITNTAGGLVNYYLHLAISRLDNVQECVAIGLKKYCKKKKSSRRSRK